MISLIIRDVLPEGGICLNRYVYDIILGALYSLAQLSKDTVESCSRCSVFLTILAISYVTFFIMGSRAWYQYVRAGRDLDGLKVENGKTKGISHIT
jgi:hypothetical protein